MVAYFTRVAARSYVRNTIRNAHLSGCYRILNVVELINAFVWSFFPCMNLIQPNMLALIRSVNFQASGHYLAQQHVTRPTLTQSCV